MARRRKRNQALVVFSKEMRVMIRDRRLVVSVVLISLVVMPFLMGFIGNINRVTGSDEEKVAVVVYFEDETLMPVLAQIPQVEVYNSAQRVRGPHLMITRVGQVYQIIGDATLRQHRVVADRIQADLESLRERIVAQYLETQGIDSAVLKPYYVEMVNTADPNRQSGALLSVLVPYLAIILLVSNANRATYIAVDEKDKNTLVSLLLTDAPRHAIVLGKIFAIMVFAVVSSLLLVAGMILFANVGFSLDSVPSEVSYSFSSAQMFQLLINLTSLALFIAAIIMLLGTYARNAREAGIYTAPLVFISIFLAVFSFSSMTFPDVAYAMPILGNALAMKDTFLEQLTTPHLLLALSANLLLAFGLVAATVQLYNRESVLFRR